MKSHDLVKELYALAREIELLPSQLNSNPLNTTNHSDSISSNLHHREAGIFDFFRYVKGKPNQIKKMLGEVSTRENEILRIFQKDSFSFLKTLPEQEWSIQLGMWSMIGKYKKPEITKSLTKHGVAKKDLDKFAPVWEFLTSLDNFMVDPEFDPNKYAGKVEFKVRQTNIDKLILGDGMIYIDDQPKSISSIAKDVIEEFMVKSIDDISLRETQGDKYKATNEIITALEDWPVSQRYKVAEAKNIMELNSSHPEFMNMVKAVAEKLRSDVLFDIFYMINDERFANSKWGGYLLFHLDMGTRDRINFSGKFNTRPQDVPEILKEINKVISDANNIIPPGPVSFEILSSQHVIAAWESLHPDGPITDYLKNLGTSNQERYDLDLAYFKDNPEDAKKVVSHGVGAYASIMNLEEPPKDNIDDKASAGVTPPPKVPVDKGDQTDKLENIKNKVNETKDKQSTLNTEMAKLDQTTDAKLLADLQSWGEKEKILNKDIGNATPAAYFISKIKEKVFSKTDIKEAESKDPGKPKPTRTNVIDIGDITDIISRPEFRNIGNKVETTVSLNKPGFYLSLEDGDVVRNVPIVKLDKSYGIPLIDFDSTSQDIINGDDQYRIIKLPIYRLGGTQPGRKESGAVEKYIQEKPQPSPNPTQAPSTQAPITQAPITQAPITQDPTTPGPNNPVQEQTKDISVSRSSEDEVKAVIKEGIDNIKYDESRLPDLLNSLMSSANINVNDDMLAEEINGFFRFDINKYKILGVEDKRVILVYANESPKGDVRLGLMIPRFKMDPSSIKKASTEFDKYFDFFTMNLVSGYASIDKLKPALILETKNLESGTSGYKTLEKGEISFIDADTPWPHGQKNTSDVKTTDYPPEVNEDPTNIEQKVIAEIAQADPEVGVEGLVQRPTQVDPKPIENRRPKLQKVPNYGLSVPEVISVYGGQFVEDIPKKDEVIFKPFAIDLADAIEFYLMEYPEHEAGIKEAIDELLKQPRFDYVAFLLSGTKFKSMAGKDAIASGRPKKQSTVDMYAKSSQSFANSLTNAIQEIITVDYIKTIATDANVAKINPSLRSETEVLSELTRSFDDLTFTSVNHQKDDLFGFVPFCFRIEHSPYILSVLMDHGRSRDTDRVKKISNYIDYDASSQRFKMESPPIYLTLASDFDGKNPFKRKKGDPKGVLLIKGSAEKL